MPKLAHRIAVVLALLCCVPAQGASAASKQPKLPDWSGTWAARQSNLAGGSGGNSGGSVVPGPVRNPYPYTPEFQSRFEANALAERSGGTLFDPAVNCVPQGMPGIMANPYPIEFLITPVKVVILIEIHGQVRRIYTDGRGHPPEEDLDYTFNGHSIGHWDGETLVVDTVGLKGSTKLDRANVHSDALHVTERIRRVDSNTLEDQVTLADAKAFTKPWSTTYHWDRKEGPEWDLKEYVCAENNRNASEASGRDGFAPPRPASR
jgi:hypothetical protein